MQKYYLNKLKNIENMVASSNDNDIKVLTYCTLPDNKIKALLDLGKGFQNSVYFDSEVELEKYNQENDITFCIEGFDIDKI